MGFIQCVGDLERHAQCLPYGQRSALQPIRQGLAFEELHHDEERAVLFADGVGGGDRKWLPPGPL